MRTLLAAQSRKWLGVTGFLLTVGIASYGLAKTAITPLTGDEQTWLTYMREEEKVARDAYLTFYELWNIRSFQNIAKSEQAHMNSLKKLLTRYGLADPVTEDTVGEFTNPELQELYNTLIGQGSLSLADALSVAVLIEKADIDDLNDAVASTTHRDLSTVYKNLIRGSNSHLKAFTKLSSLGSPATCTGTGTGTCSATGTGTLTGKKAGACTSTGCTLK